MSSLSPHTQSTSAIAFRSVPWVPSSDFASDVREGLARPGQKELFSKYLYDDVGSALFEVITLLPEYGLTRAGSRLMRRYADEIVAHIPGRVVVAELGSGSAKKTRWILASLSRRQPVNYYPIDISAAALLQSQRELGDLPSVHLVGFEREYLDGLLEVTARRHDGEHLLLLFLGSTIGNFERAAGEAFLQEVRALLQEDDYLLLATDLLKPVSQMLLAYDDPIGATAAFNLNLLARINRELGGDFDLRKFRHQARFCEEKGRIEMHLLSEADQTVEIPGAGISVHFRKGETIWTESSHKYSLGEVQDMAADNGYRCVAQWVDQEWPFAQSLFKVV
jgi:dimethylhistidine N-methyltransferase